MFIKIFSSYPVVIAVGSANALQLRERFLKHKTMWKGSFSLVPKVVIRRVKLAKKGRFGEKKKDSIEIYTNDRSGYVE